MICLWIINPYIRQARIVNPSQRKVRHYHQSNESNRITQSSATSRGKRWLICLIEFLLPPCVEGIFIYRAYIGRLVV